MIWPHEPDTHVTVVGDFEVARVGSPAELVEAVQHDPFDDGAGLRLRAFRSPGRHHSAGARAMISL